MSRKRIITSLFLALGAVLGECAAASIYGPLTFNKAEADFYFSQAGQFARTELGPDGVVDVHLESAPFQIGYNGQQLNLALAQSPITEISTDPTGYKASRLSGAMTGSRERDSDALLVYSGKKWSDGNTELSDNTSRKTNPMPGYHYAYQINQVEFLDDKSQALGTFKGVLYGFIAVYKQPERSNKDIMPIRLHFN